MITYEHSQMNPVHAFLENMLISLLQNLGCKIPPLMKLQEVVQNNVIRLFESQSLQEYTKHGEQVYGIGLKKILVKMCIGMSVRGNGMGIFFSSSLKEKKLNCWPW